MNFGYLISAFLLALVLTMLIYLLVPVIFCLRKKPIAKAKIRKIIIINAICVWSVCHIIGFHMEASDHFCAMILWSWVGYKIMMKYLAIKEETSKKSRPRFAQPTMKSYEPHKKDTPINKTTKKTESDDSSQ